MNKYTEYREGNIAFWRIENDTNGNPRYIFHFLEISEKYERGIKIA